MLGKKTSLVSTTTNFTIPRVRFAPSPTGEPHLGNIRSALFNYLFAKRYGGTFILRIEDTDRTRYEEKALQSIMESLRWLGLLWDEGPEIGGPHGPYFQSDRLDIYHEQIEHLIKSGAAYYCDCTAERLDNVRTSQAQAKQPPRYDRRCRHRKLKGNIGDGRYVVRFAVPDTGSTTFNDAVRGDITFSHAELDDYVLIKSDGFPTYHFANVVDDHLMEITHVMRAEEWISSTPKHVLLYEAFHWKPPTFAHLPLILGPDKSKLSKRHGATSVLAYRELGYMPEALVNFLALLGWSPRNDQEIFAPNELQSLFSFEGINPVSGVFDIAKLEWMNGQYLHQLDDKTLLYHIRPFLEAQGLLPGDIGPQASDEGYQLRVMALLRERIRTFCDVPKVGSFFFVKPAKYDPAGVEKHFRVTGCEDHLQVYREAIATLNEENWSAANLEATLRSICESLGIKAGELIHPTRLAVSGLTVGPSLFGILELLGSNVVLRRLDEAIVYIHINEK